VLTSWPAFHAREAVLRDLEQAIRKTPEALDTRFYYASFLRDHGRFDDALAMFESVLAVAPAHVETLVAYGVLLARRGRRLDARAAFERAVAADGEHNGAVANLANLVALDEPERAAALYRAVLARDGNFAPAHRGLCSLNAARGDIGAAAVHRAAGYAAGPFGRRAYTGETMPVNVVALVSTDGGNIPLDALLDERVFLVRRGLPGRSAAAARADGQRDRRRRPRQRGAGLRVGDRAGHRTQRRQRAARRGRDRPHRECRTPRAAR
jgi:tetratricopeptide (TPR) repeat protein